MYICAGFNESWSCTTSYKPSSYIYSPRYKSCDPKVVKFTSSYFINPLVIFTWFLLGRFILDSSSNAKGKFSIVDNTQSYVTVSVCSSNNRCIHKKDQLCILKSLKNTEEPHCTGLDKDTTIDRYPNVCIFIPNIYLKQHQQRHLILTILTQYGVFNQ